jgi:hypothetical protein
MKKWEYMWLWKATDGLINEFGAKGWELVSVVIGEDGEMQHWFKRPLSGKAKAKEA